MEYPTTPVLDGDAAKFRLAKTPFGGPPLERLPRAIGFVQNHVLRRFGGYGGQIITENGKLQKKVGEKIEIKLQK